MNIYQNGRVYNNVYKEYISEIKKEVFTPSLLFLGIDQLFSYFKSHTIVPLFRVLKLRENETVDGETISKVWKVKEIPVLPDEDIGNGKEI